MISPSLQDRYRQETGIVFLTGVQAIVRFLIEKQRRDAVSGAPILRTFVAGYEGSPLGGLDLEIRRNMKLLTEVGIFVHQPAVNEKIAAASVHGSQYNGDVDGFWYGKAHGVKWALDELSLANIAGTGAHSGTVYFAGDDHMAKSSGYPASSEFSFRDARTPVFYPSSVSEILDFAHHALALSRYSGLVCGLKLVTPICDGAETVAVQPDHPVVTLPDYRVAEKPYIKTFQPVVIATSSIPYEAEIGDIRLDIAREYARLNPINTILNGQTPGPIGLIATGKSLPDTLLALRAMQLDKQVRLLKIGMIYPLDPEIVRTFAQGLETVVVIEEKGPFVEAPIAQALLGSSVRQIWGKRGPDGRPFVPAHGELGPDLLVRLLGPVLRASYPVPSIDKRLNGLKTISRRTDEAFPRRAAHYCPGCPHSISARAPSGEIAGGEIGCSSLDAYIRADGRGVRYIPTMGMGGALYNGIFPFNGNQHLIQNIGDGTVLHSGLLTLFSSMSHGANITYKILWNHVVAMTGGQDITGQPSLEDFVSVLFGLGVKDVAVVSRYPKRVLLDRVQANLKPDQRLSLEPRDRLAAVQEALARRPGVNVLIYDQECATEARRRRKRQGTPVEEYVVIHEDVCEGCGDCGRQSMCLALYPANTPFGQKTSILQSACNQDASCLKGDCPSFVTVTPRNGTTLQRLRIPSLAETDMSEPFSKARIDGTYAIHIIGVGGTGVVTVAHLLGFAALFENVKVNELNRTGLAQKGGPVESPVILGDPDMPLSSYIPAGTCDLYLAADIVGAVNPANLQVAAPDRTVAIVSRSAIPTAEMVYNPQMPHADIDHMERVINTCTRAEDNLFIDAQEYAVKLFDNHIVANMFHLGVAYQAGRIPLRADNIERAIQLNGQSVETNLQAFRWGRMAVQDRARLDALIAPPPDTDALLRDRVGQIADTTLCRELTACIPVTEEPFFSMWRLRVADLIAYQDAACAKRYVETVARIFEADRQNGGEDHSYLLTYRVAFMMYKLMAYKDEYEVARLLTGSGEQKIRDKFDGKTDLSYHLHPPFLRALGLKQKIRLGSWFRPMLCLMARLKFLRGTVFDPFGRTSARREERELVAWYERLTDEALRRLNTQNYPKIVELLGIPDRIRGYEEVKRRSVEQTKRQAERLLAALDEKSPKTVGQTESKPR
ncbi:MAG: indolepyruvate ferredoxin oxidoreductase family protein [candidate division Zixibacteria bacterium]|nr:indolepyruvate ferredoxin oxidoreductase family protein [candidate division Zixibacteria bacterium]